MLHLVLLLLLLLLVLVLLLLLGRSTLPHAGCSRLYTNKQTRWRKKNAKSYDRMYGGGCVRGLQKDENKKIVRKNNRPRRRRQCVHAHTR